MLLVHAYIHFDEREVSETSEVSETASRGKLQKLEIFRNFNSSRNFVEREKFQNPPAVWPAEADSRGRALPQDARNLYSY
jgi:hypothetical protein